MWKWYRKQPTPQPQDDSRLIRRHPELGYLDNPKDRSTVYVMAMTAAGKGTGLWILLLAIVLMSCWFTLLRILEQYAPSSWCDTLGSPGSVCSFFFAGLIILRFRNRQFNHCLREQLARRGIRICVKCGYDLRGQPEPRCPECGVRFNPDLLKDTATPPPQSPIEQKPTQPAKLGWKAARREYKATQRLATFPDLALFPAEERETVWTRARNGSAYWTVAGITVVCLGSTTTFVIFKVFVAPHLRPPAKPLGLAFFVTIVAVFTLTLAWQWLATRLRGRHTERFLRQQLNLRGHALCLKCGYDLKGQTAPRCPECGTDFDPRLLQHDDKLAPVHLDDGRQPVHIGTKR